MATVTLSIAGRRYEMACRDGEQAHLETLAALVDAKARQASAAVAGLTETRLLMLAALLLADDLHELRGGSTGAVMGKAPSIEEEAAPLIDALADRIERLAVRLEKSPSSS